jgi:hypothetical protein
VGHEWVTVFCAPLLTIRRDAIGGPGLPAELQIKDVVVNRGLSVVTVLWEFASADDAPTNRKLINRRLAAAAKGLRRGLAHDLNMKRAPVCPGIVQFLAALDRAAC